MALLKRQFFTYGHFDDQSPILWGFFTDKWTRYASSTSYNYTLTATPTPGTSLSFTFIGAQAWVYGGLNANDTADGFIASLTPGSQIYTYPTADYKIDGSPLSPQKPFVDIGGKITYLQTPIIANGTHKIDIVVTSANATNQFIIDCFVTLQSGPNPTSYDIPSPTVTLSGLHSAPVGVIIGGVDGCVAAVAILVIALWYFLKRRSRGQTHHKPEPGGTLADEAPSSAGFSELGSHSTHSDGSSSQPSNLPVTQAGVDSLPSQPSGRSGPGETIWMTYVSGNMAQPRNGKAALMAQQHQNVQQPIQYDDSGVRFNENGEQESGPSQSPNEVPPTYTPQ